jgi:aerobic carbon-monoxide dehydrogenase medium subunit
VLPPRFEYHRPSSLDEALSLLDTYGEDAKVLAGGQSLIPLMKLRLATPAHLIDVNRIPGLDTIDDRDGTLRIGALVRHAQLATSEAVSARYPTIAAAAPMIADPLVRNVGTIGGSLTHADPSGDLGSVMLALGASVVLRSARGEREVAIHDYLVDTFQTSIAPNELLTEVRVPAPSASAGGTYLKLERKVGDFATVGAAVFLSLDDGDIGRAGIGLTSVGLTNIDASDAAAALVGRPPDEDAFADAASLAARAASPATDVRGSADYKRHVVDVFVRRGLARAAEMAGHR